jgi:hypothetical protein
MLDRQGVDVMRICRVVVAVGLCAVLQACSTVAHTERSEQRAKLSVAYNASAGEPVRNFRFGHLVAADALNDQQLVVRAWPHAKWLLTVEDDCDLDTATSPYYVTSSLRRVTVNNDRVLFGSPDRHGACRIRQIRPLDMDDVAAVSPGG